jgi:hypothetical protein
MLGQRLDIALMSNVDNTDITAANLPAATWSLAAAYRQP